MDDLIKAGEVRQFRPHQSYEIGLMATDSETQDPKFVKGKRVTIHGSDFLKWKIKTVYDLAENKTPELRMIPGRNYQVRELDEYGRPEYFGQFSPKRPPEPKPKKSQNAGLSDIFQPQQTTPAPPLEPMPQQPEYGLTLRRGDDGYPLRSHRDIKEAYEAQLSQQAAMFESRIRDKDQEIARLQESHQQELTRTLDIKNTEMFALQSSVAALEAKVEEWTSNCFEEQRKSILLEKEKSSLASQLESVIADNKRRLQTMKEEYDKRIEILNLDLQTKFARQSQLNGVDNGWESIIKTVASNLPAIVGLFNGSASNAQPATATPIHNPAQNLQGIQQPPPPPRFIPIPESAENTGVQS